MRPRWLIAVVALLGTALGLWTAWQVSDRGPSDPNPNLVDATALFGQERPLPPFALVDHTGRAFTNATLNDHWTLVFFGYTHCPDVCPMTLGNANAMLAQLRDDAIREQVHVAFVSVDPKRDSKQRLAEFVPFFNADFVGVTGTDAELKKFSGALNAIYSVGEPNAEGNYVVDHSSRLLLIGPRGRFTAVLSEKSPPNVLAKDLQTIIDAYSS